jgi:hypothetical protein
MTFLAKGAYGSVFRCKLATENRAVAVKLMELPRHINDRYVTNDIS